MNKEFYVYSYQVMNGNELVAIGVVNHNSHEEARLYIHNLYKYEDITYDKVIVCELCSIHMDKSVVGFLEFYRI